MTATLQSHGAVGRLLLIAYCPVCGRVVESQVLVILPGFIACIPGTPCLHPLSPDVGLRDEGRGLQWIHGSCGRVLIEIETVRIYVG